MELGILLQEMYETSSDSRYAVNIYIGENKVAEKRLLEQQTPHKSLNEPLLLVEPTVFNETCHKKRRLLRCVRDNITETENSTSFCTLPPPPPPPLPSSFSLQQPILPPPPPPPPLPPPLLPSFPTVLPLIRQASEPKRIVSSSSSSSARTLMDDLRDRMISIRESRRYSESDEDEKQDW
jgi:hypothetical protein